MIINDNLNAPGKEGVELALKHIREQEPNKLGIVKRVEVSMEDSEATLDAICNEWKELIRREDIVPDFVLDTTTAGLGADTVASFTAGLGIPTLSAQYAQEGDLRNWKEVPPEQAKYLVQIQSPGDLMPEGIREVVSSTNISNAAILFDDTFNIDHKYKRLLLNVPVRHIIQPLEQTRPKMIEHITKLRDLDMVNYFVLGSEKNLSMVLSAADRLNYTGHR